MSDGILEFDHGLPMGFAQQARMWTSRGVAQDPHGLLPYENVPSSSLVCVKCQKSDPHPTLVSPSRQATRLKQIREMLGVPEPMEKEPDKFLGDADAGADEPAPGYLCPVRQQGPDGPGARAAAAHGPRDYGHAVSQRGLCREATQAAGGQKASP